MAQMIPAYIERNDPRRTGEYMVYDWLSSSKIPGIAFYSQPQTTHESKTMSEADFIYLCEEGLLCIEVKGGKVSSNGGNWISTDKKEIEHKIKHPFFQAHGCMKALMAYVEKIYGVNSVESSFRRGYCVVFPECICASTGMGVVNELQFDAGNEIDEFYDFLKNSIQYNVDDEYRKQQKHLNRLSSEDVENMTILLEADFGAVPSMKLQFDTAYDKLVELTNEQRDLVDDMSENKAVIIQGAAGTGKSLLACWKAQRALAMKKSVVYLCFNRNMATYARKQIGKGDKLYVGTFHAFVSKITGLKTNEMSVDDAAKFLLEEGNKIAKYDVLIVDEAQDILSINVVKCLNEMVVGGLIDGEWSAFTDPNQNIFSKDELYNDGLEYIKSISHPCIFSLNTNCRNTAPIARKTAVLTETPPVKHLKTTGPRVETVFYKDKFVAIEKLDKCIHGLIAGGTFANNIVVLSTKTLKNSVLSEVSELSGMRINEVEDIRQMEDDTVNFFTAQSFKGLESKIVIYTDIDGFIQNSSRRINYVAMSRASVMLYLFVNEALREEYEKAEVEGLDILR